MRTTRNGLVVVLLLAAAAWSDEPPKPSGASDAERANVRRIVQELRAEVARIRGLEWKQDVPADLLTRDQMVEWMRRELEVEYPPEKVARDEKILRRTGLLAEGQSFIQMNLDMLRAGVAGFYDAKTKKLYLVEGATGDAQRPPTLHELTHALDDQHFDLDARTKPYEEEPDRLFAEKCVEEGCAEHARLLYERAHPDIGEMWERSQSTPDQARTQLQLLRMPAWLLLPLMLNYTIGPRLVAQYVGDDFPGGMKRLMERPPTTQEQCLHPDRWLGEKKDLPRKVVWGGDFAAAAGAGWKKLHEMPSGELDLALWLDFHLGSTRGRIDPRRLAEEVPVAPKARIAAAGWDAGRDVFLETEGRQLLWVWVAAFDSDADALEAAEASRDALQKLAGESYRGGTWTSTADGRMADYVTAAGRGRVLLRGDEVLFVDGVPSETFGTFWDVVARTKFERDPADGY